MVASKPPLIGKTRMDILKKGGNTVDAVVAAAFVDVVAESVANGIGGEGVMAIYMVDGKKRHYCLCRKTIERLHSRGGYLNYLFHVRKSARKEFLLKVSLFHLGLEAKNVREGKPDY